MSTLLLSYVVPVKSKVEILQNFVTFSEYMNFTFLNSTYMYQLRKSSSKHNLSGSGCIFSNSPSVGVRRSKAKRGQDECCYSFFLFFFFCRGRDIFAKIKHTKLTYYSTFISRIQHKISIFFLLFFRETDVVNRSSFIFSSLGFSFGLSFLTFFKWWQWLEGHSFGLVLGIFVFVLNYSDLFGFIRSSRQAWLGES